MEFSEIFNSTTFEFVMSRWFAHFLFWRQQFGHAYCIRNLYRRFDFERIAAMANEDLTQFEGLLAQLMSPDNNTRQLAEVRTLVFYMCIDLLHLIGNFGLDRNRPAYVDMTALNIAVRFIGNDGINICIMLHITVWKIWHKAWLLEYYWSPSKLKLTPKSEDYLI